MEKTSIHSRYLFVKATDWLTVFEFILRIIWVDIGTVYVYN